MKNKPLLTANEGVKPIVATFFLLFVSLVLTVICSCSGGSTNSVSGGDTLQLKYAKNLCMVRHDGYTIVTMADPWHKDKTLHRYVLASDSAIERGGLPEGTVIRTPMRSAVVFTTIHSSLFLSLGARDIIKGVCDLRYIKLPWIQEQCRLGRIKDCGSGMSPDIEKIIDTKPDAILLSPFENSGGYGKLEEVDIPIVECADYMENSPLARAEWMRFFGMLTGHEREADSMFNAVEQRYLALKETAEKTKSRPSVVIDKKSGGVWYVAGGQSTMGTLIDDAGGQYVFASEKKSGSIAMPFEAVLDRAGQADIWLMRYSSDHPLTLRELLSEHEGYGQMKAYRQGRVYGCNTKTSLFFEESLFWPDRLLADFISIIHPEVEDIGEARYFQLLK